jgi:NADH-quinone oxidoreductase subunit M
VIRQILLTESLLLGVLVSLDLSILTAVLDRLAVACCSSCGRVSTRACADDDDSWGWPARCRSWCCLLDCSLGVLRAKSGAAVQTPYDLMALAQRQADDPLPSWLGGLAMVGALVRMGCFPAPLLDCPTERARARHRWCSPRLRRRSGLFLMTRVTMPLFPELVHAAMPLLLPLGLLTATYGAILAMAQYDLRRMLGYFWISQQGFSARGDCLDECAGREWCADPRDRNGGGAHGSGAADWLDLCADGNLTDVRQTGGAGAHGARAWRRAFCCLAMAAVGSPGTLGFVSEDLIVQGLLDHHSDRGGDGAGDDGAQRNPAVSWRFSGSSSVMAGRELIHGVTRSRICYRESAGWRWRCLDCCWRGGLCRHLCSR